MATEIQRYDAGGRGFSISKAFVGYRVHVWTTKWYGQENLRASFLLYKNVVKFLEDYREWWTT